MSEKKSFVKNPYPGIRSFNVDENHLFFGREKQIEELSDILIHSNFLAITGSSGSGKSSLIKAGLIPHLTKTSDNWSHIVFRPGNDLFQNMSIAFVKLFKQYGISEKRAHRQKEIEIILRKGLSSFTDFLKEIEFYHKIVLYIDQFEEIFRFRKNIIYSEAKLESEKFVDFLIDAANNKELPISVIISLRTDFLSDCTDFPNLPRMINEGHYLIPKMTLNQKEKAFTQPAIIGGAKLSKGLIQLLRNDIEKYETGLPILQHSLMRTWDYWLVNSHESDIITEEHYIAIGTVKNALSVHAEQIYGQFTEDYKRKITEDIFKALTYLGEDNRGTRRPTSLADICVISESREEDVVEVIDVFRAKGNSFLFPSADINLTPTTIIDISHESIMRIWKRLIDWVREETDSAQLYLRISKSAELYQLGKTGLLVNPDLLLALNWQKNQKPNDVWAKRYDASFDRTINYLTYSKQEHDRIVEVAAKRKENSIKRTRFFVFFLSAASLISILFLVVALNLQFKAKSSEKKAKEKEEVAISESKVADEKRKEAISQGNIAEQQQSIAEEQKLLAEAQKLFAITQQTEALKQKSLAETAKAEAILSRDQAVKLKKQAEVLRDNALEQKRIAESERLRAELSEAKTDTLRRLSIAQTLAGNAIKVKENQTDETLLTQEQKDLPAILALQAYYFNKNFGGSKYNPEVFSALAQVADASVLIKGKDAHSNAVRNISISPDGQSFVSCSDDGSLKLFDLNKLPKSKELKTPAIGRVSYRTVLYSKNGLIIAGTNKGHIVIWNSQAIATKPLVYSVHKGIVFKIIGSSDGKSFYSASKDGTLKAWSSDNITSVKTYYSKSGISDIFLSETDNSLLVSSNSGEINYLNPSDLSVKKTERAKNEGISSLYLTPNNELILGLSSGKIEIISSGISKIFSAHASEITDLDFDNKTNRLISCSYDGLIKIWDFKNIEKQMPLVIDQHKSWVYAIALTSDSKQLISASADKNILVTKIDIEDLKTAVRKTVNKNMSELNWRKYVGKGIDYFPNLPE